MVKEVPQERTLFLSGTFTDLEDYVQETKSILEERGVKVIHFKNADFHNGSIGKHIHDICIDKAKSTSDYLLIVDRKGGDDYEGMNSGYKGLTVTHAEFQAAYDASRTNKTRKIHIFVRRNVWEFYELWKCLPRNEKKTLEAHIDPRVYQLLEDIDKKGDILVDLFSDLRDLKARLADKFKPLKNKKKISVFILIFLFFLLISLLFIKIVTKESLVPYIDIIPVGWRQVQAISGDWGIKAGFTIYNYDEKLTVKEMHILDEYYMRIDLPDIQSNLFNKSETLDQQKDNIISSYMRRRFEIYGKITDLFENKYKPNMDLKELQGILTEEGIHVEVYNQEKQYYFKPRFLIPRERYFYGGGRSTSIETLESNILDKGTQLIVIASILEYKLHDNSAWRSFLISHSELGWNKVIVRPEGSYYPLTEYKQWNKKIEN